MTDTVRRQLETIADRHAEGATYEWSDGGTRTICNHCRNTSGMWWVIWPCPDRQNADAALRQLDEDETEPPLTPRQTAFQWFLNDVADETAATRRIIRDAGKRMYPDI